MYTAAVIIPAAGRGRRMGQAGRPKQYLPLFGKSILRWTMEACAASRAVRELILVVAAEDAASFQAELATRRPLDKPVRVVPGGPERQDSVRAGLAAVGRGTDVVAVHDGVRPLVKPALLDAVLAAAARHGAATAAVPLKDTVKLVEGPWVQATPERERLRLVQTPQAFRRELLEDAHFRAVREGWRATDDATLVERAGHPVAVVEGAYDNIKITTPEDLLLAETLLRAREWQLGTGAVPQQAPAAGRQQAQEGASVRIGIGYDVHPLVACRPLILGGVEIPFELGLAGHSDADVLLHAIMDAMLGAAGLGDIGVHFPPGDPAYAGASSLKLLEEVRERVAERGFRVGNVDATVVAERPRLRPYVPAMVERIAACLQVAPEAVNVKATTAEGLGFVGARQGIVAHATALLLGGY
ncbi:MAG: 2-C-methyl-D-erythritol 4-phosphate cytidylyltransferase [Firmicutes bacterium]|nr:2-C-methyl-D-erythritol 4-phosphate cytidylyltransferase [Bacillota bacterium]